MTIIYKCDLCGDDIIDGAGRGLYRLTMPGKHEFCMGPMPSCVKHLCNFCVDGLREALKEPPKGTFL